MKTGKQDRLDKHDKTHPMNVPGTRQRVRPKGKTEWTFTPWIRVRAGTDLLEMLDRARKDQVEST